MHVPFPFPSHTVECPRQSNDNIIFREGRARDGCRLLGHRSRFPTGEIPFHVRHALDPSVDSVLPASWQLPWASTSTVLRRYPLCPVARSGASKKVGRRSSRHQFRSGSGGLQRSYVDALLRSRCKQDTQLTESGVTES